MFKTFDFRGVSLRYSDAGEGFPLLFLHGYLESAEIWSAFIPDLLRDFRVVTLDLPGHGESGLPGGEASMEVISESAEALLDHLKLDQAFWIGHSMGGYASLAQLERNPSRMAAICLFHSHTRPDSEIIKDKRKREIHIVEQGQKRLLVMQNIPNMFAPQNLVAFEHELELTRSLAHQTHDAGVVAALKGLMMRPDRSEVLASAALPCLQIIGRYDQYISFDEVSMKTDLPRDSERLILDHSGHMGFFEEKARCLAGIRTFAEKLLRR